MGLRGAHIIAIMRSMTENAPALPVTGDIAVKAAGYPFLATAGRIVLTVLLAALISAGWLAGSTWFGMVFTLLWTWDHLRWAGAAVSVGYRAGAKVKTGKVE